METTQSAMHVMMATARLLSLEFLAALRATVRAASASDTSSADSDRVPKLVVRALFAAPAVGARSLSPCHQYEPTTDAAQNCQRTRAAGQK